MKPKLTWEQTVPGVCRALTECWASPVPITSLCAPVCASIWFHLPKGEVVTGTVLVVTGTVLVQHLPKGALVCPWISKEHCYFKSDGGTQIEGSWMVWRPQESCWVAVSLSHWSSVILGSDQTCVWCKAAKPRQGWTQSNQPCPESPPPDNTSSSISLLPQGSTTALGPVCQRQILTQRKSSPPYLHSWEHIAQSSSQKECNMINGNVPCLLVSSLLPHPHTDINFYSFGYLRS